MNKEDERWDELWRGARTLSHDDVRSLEEKLEREPQNLEIRVQLFSHYRELEGNGLKHANAEQRLSEHILWMIENKPAVPGYLSHRVNISGLFFGPKLFAKLRTAWLEQVALDPLNGTILGNAASFLAWTDIETAESLAERAYALQPTAGWLQTFLIHHYHQLWNCPSIYQDRIHEKVIDVGVRSLKTELDGAPFLLCDYVCDAAISLGRYELIPWCAKLLYDRKVPSLSQVANAYLGLVALRQDKRELAVQFLLEMKRGYGPQPVVFRLATELFEAGERDSIVEFIKSLGRKIKTHARNRWLAKIASDECPDFEDYCRCRTCSEVTKK